MTPFINFVYFLDVFFLLFLYFTIHHVFQVVFESHDLGSSHFISVGGLGRETEDLRGRYLGVKVLFRRRLEVSHVYSRN